MAHYLISVLDDTTGSATEAEMAAIGELRPFLGA